MDYEKAYSQLKAIIYSDNPAHRRISKAQILIEKLDQETKEDPLVTQLKCAQHIKGMMKGMITQWSDKPKTEDHVRLIIAAQDIEAFTDRQITRLEQEVAQ